MTAKLARDNKWRLTALKPARLGVSNIEKKLHFFSNRSSAISSEGNRSKSKLASSTISGHIVKKKTWWTFLSEVRVVTPENSGLDIKMINSCAGGESQVKSLEILFRIPSKSVMVMIVNVPKHFLKPSKHFRSICRWFCLILDVFKAHFLVFLRFWQNERTPGRAGFKFPDGVHGTALSIVAWSSSWASSTTVVNCCSPYSLD